MGFSLGSLFGGGGGGPGPVLDKSAFDLSSSVKKFGGFSEAQLQQAKQRQDFTNAANQQLIQQLQQQAGGQGPSLAQAQLKAMQDRGIAQTMAAAASQRGGNPALAQRQLMMQQAAGGRAAASQGAILGLQERQGAQQLLAGQLLGGQGQADALANKSIDQGFGQEESGKKMMGQYETTRFNGDVARHNAIKKQQSDILGSVLGAAGTVGGAMLGGPVGAGFGSVIGGKLGGMFSSSGYAGGEGVPSEAATANFMQSKAHGGVIEGTAKVPGDSPQNDTEHVMLSPGEIVVPRSIIAAGPDAAKSFIEAIMQANKKPSEVGFAAVAASKKPKKMYEGGRVPAPATKSPREYSTVEKPVQNQWKGFDAAWSNVKRELGMKKKKGQ